MSRASKGGALIDVAEHQWECPDAYAADGRAQVDHIGIGNPPRPNATLPE